MKTQKKRLIKSLDGLPKNLMKLIHEQYPSGYQDAVTRIQKTKNETIFVFPIETPDATYLIKIPAVKNSDSERDMEEEDKDDEVAEFSAKGYDDDMDSDDENEGMTAQRRRDNNKEASYEPDFD